MPSTTRVLPIDLVQRSSYRALAPAPTVADVDRYLQDAGDPDPIVVRKIPNGRYEILAGEFAWRLVQAAGLHAIPATVVDVDDVAARALARKDARADAARHATLGGALAAHTRATGCADKLRVAREIRDACADASISKAVAGAPFGLSPSEVSHYLRVLRLPDAVLRYGESGAVSFAQLRTLSRLAEQPQRAHDLALRVVNAARGCRYRRASSITVRQLEQLVDEALSASANTEEGDGRGGEPSPGGAAAPPGTSEEPKYLRGDADIRSAETTLSDRCGHRVEIDFDPRTKSGWIRVRFSDLSDYDSVAALLGGLEPEFD